MHAKPSAETIRHLLAVAVVALTAGLATGFAPTLFVPCDFLAFWSSAILFTTGQNPYDPTLLLPIQYEMGFQLGYAIAIFYPPWVLPLFAPLAALPLKAAFAVWLGLQFALTLVAGGWLWRSFGGAADREWIAGAITIVFIPTFLLLTAGQLTGLTLFGLAGFLYFRERRPYLAGCLGALTAVKPHLFGLFAVALVIDAVRSREGRKVVLAGGLALLAGSLLVEAARPGVFGEFVTALTVPSSDVVRGMTDYPAPVVGMMLRNGLPGRPILAQFAPLMLAGVCLLAFTRRLPLGDRWPATLPWLVLGSLVIAPYGAWWYDMVLLLPLVLLVTVRLDQSGSSAAQRAGRAAFLLLDVVLMALYEYRDDLTPLFALIVPLSALGSLALLRAQVAGAEGGAGGAGGSSSNAPSSDVMI